MKLTKKEWFILGGGVIAGLMLSAIFRANKNVNQSENDKDAEYFAFADGGIKLGDKGQSVNRMKLVINRFGYNLPLDGLYDRETKKVVLNALHGTKFINNRRNEGEIDVRFVDGMEKIFENAEKRQGV